MKMIELPGYYLTIEELLRIACRETIILRQAENKIFVVAPIDDSDIEVEILRNNKEFMAYLDGVSKQKATISLEEAEKRLGLIS